MPSPINSGVFRFHIPDLFNSKPKPSERIQAMAADGLEDFNAARKEVKKIAIGDVEIARIAKYSPDDATKNTATIAGELARRVSENARIAIYGGALATLSHPLGQMLAQGLSDTAYEAVKRCTVPQSSKEISDAFGDEIAACSPKEVKTFIGVMKKIDEVLPDEARTAGFAGGFNALSTSISQPLGEILLTAARASLETPTAAESQALASRFYMKEFACLSEKLETERASAINVNAAPPPLPALMAPVGAFLSNITQDLTRSLVDKKMESHIRGAYFEMLAHLSPEPSVKALATAASNALSPEQPLCRTSFQEAEEVSRVVIERMTEKVPQKPGDALLQVSQTLVGTISDPERLASAVRPFFQEMEKYHGDYVTKSLARAAVNAREEKSVSSLSESAAYRAVMEVLREPSGDGQTMLAHAALKAMLTCNIMGGSAYGVTRNEKEACDSTAVKVAQAFMEEIARSAGDPVSKALAETTLTAFSSKHPSVAVIAYTEVLNALSQRPLQSLEEACIKVMKSIASLDPPCRETAQASTAFAGKLMEMTDNEALKHMISAALHIEGCRNCFYSEKIKGTNSYPNSDVYAIRSLADALQSPQKSLPPEKAVAELALAGIAGLKTNPEEIYDGGVGLLSESFMNEIRKCTDDPRITALIDNAASIIRSVHFKDKNTSLLLYNELFSIISKGFSGNAGEEYALLAKASNAEQGFPESRANKSRQFMEKCAETSQDSLLKALLPVISHLPDEAFYDSSTFLYCAMADLFLAPHSEIPVEKALITIASEAVSRMVKSSCQQDDKYRGIYEITSCTAREIGAVSTDPVVKSLVKKAETIPSFMDEHYKQSIEYYGYHTMGVSERTKMEKEKPRFDGPAACMRALLRIIADAPGTALEKLYATVALDAMSIAETPEGKAVSARPFIDALGGLVTDPRVAALLGILENLPDEHSYESEASISNEALSALINPEETDKPLHEYIAARGLDAALASPEKGRGEIVTAYLKGVEKSLSTQSGTGKSVKDEKAETLKSLMRIATAPLRQLENQELLGIDALSFAASPEKRGEPLHSFLASRALALGANVHSSQRLEIYWAGYREIISLMKDEELARQFKVLCESHTPYEQKLKYFEKALTNIVETQQSLDRLKEPEASDARDVEIHVDDDGKDVLNIDGIRLAIRQEEPEKSGSSSMTAVRNNS